ncbi:MAG: hypothetical protein ACR2OW_15420 [Methyloligellaceae bacterium]
MSLNTAHHHEPSFRHHRKSPLESASDFFAGIGDFFSRITNAVQCSNEVSYLMSLSDNQLARRDLKREDIVDHVFKKYMQNQI